MGDINQEQQGKESNENSGKVVLSFSERKDRIVLTVSAAAAILTALMFVTKLVASAFSQYTLGEIPFTLEQFLFSSVLASGIMIFGLCLRYLYSEFFNLHVHKSDVDTKLNFKKADNNYLKMIDGTRFLLYFTAFSWAVEFSFSNISPLLEFLIIIVIAFFIAFIAKKYIKDKMVKFVTFINEFFGSNIEEEQNIDESENSSVKASVINFFKRGRFYTVCIWVFVFCLCMFFGASIGELHGRAVAKFQNNDRVSSLLLEFHDTMPEDIEIYIYPSDYKGEYKPNIRLTAEDLDQSYTRAMLQEKNIQHGIIDRMLSRETNYRVDNSKSTYFYSKQIDISPYLKEGNNTIFITFRDDDSTENKKYEMFNEVEKRGFVKRFTKEELDVSL